MLCFQKCLDTLTHSVPFLFLHLESPFFRDRGENYPIVHVLLLPDSKIQTFPVCVLSWNQELYERARDRTCHILMEQFPHPSFSEEKEVEVARQSLENKWATVSPQAASVIQLDSLGINREIVANGKIKKTSA